MACLAARRGSGGVCWVGAIFRELKDGVDACKGSLAEKIADEVAGGGGGMDDDGGWVAACASVMYAAHGLRDEGDVLEWCVCGWRGLGEGLGRRWVV